MHIIWKIVVVVIATVIAATLDYKHWKENKR